MSKINIQYISDIHLELLNDDQTNFLTSLLRFRSKICVLSGDIGNPFLPNYVNFLSHIHENFDKIFLITGNHEFYNNNIDNTIIKITELIANLPKITFLNNSYEDYCGIRFIGTTLWTNITEPEYQVNDITCINDFSIEKYNQLHADSVHFLETELENCLENNIKTIIITHHLPIYELTHYIYRRRWYEKYSQWYNSNLDELVKKYSPIISKWIYGHTHKYSVQLHYDVVFYCNPIGYLNQNKLSVDSVNKNFTLYT